MIYIYIYIYQCTLHTVAYNGVCMHEELGVCTSGGINCSLQL